jgi:hypothetical protein
MIRRYCKEIEIMRDSRGQNYRTPYTCISHVPSVNQIGTVHMFICTNNK